MDKKLDKKLKQSFQRVHDDVRSKVSNLRRDTAIEVNRNRKWIQGLCFVCAFLSLCLVFALN